MTDMLFFPRKPRGKTFANSMNKDVEEGVA
jgi:hypothetical protein